MCYLLPHRYPRLFLYPTVPLTSHAVPYFPPLCCNVHLRIHFATSTDSATDVKKRNKHKKKLKEESDGHEE